MIDCRSQSIQQTDIVTLLFSPTADLGVSVFGDNAVGSLGGMEQNLPGQRVGVAQLGIIVQQDQTSTDAAE